LLPLLRRIIIETKKVEIDIEDCRRQVRIVVPGKLFSRRSFWLLPWSRSATDRFLEDCFRPAVTTKEAIFVIVIGIMMDA